MNDLLLQLQYLGESQKNSLIWDKLFFKILSRRNSQSNHLHLHHSGSLLGIFLGGLFVFKSEFHSNAQMVFKKTIYINQMDQIWLVVSTHLKNISQIGNLPQIGVTIKNVWNHHLEMDSTMKTPANPSSMKLRYPSRTSQKTVAIPDALNQKEAFTVRGSTVDGRNPKQPPGM